MTSAFWGINLVSEKKREKAKTIVLYSVLSYDIGNTYLEIEKQVSVLFPNNFIILHYIKQEEYEQLKDVKEINQK